MEMGILVLTVSQDTFDCLTKWGATKLKRYDYLFCSALISVTLVTLLSSCSNDSNNQGSSIDSPEQVAVISVTYLVNDNGETYGSADGALVSTPEGVVLDKEKLPDLVQVINREGLIGYCRSEDLYPDPPSDPSEVEEYNREVNEPLVMYESDGETVIGRFPS